MNEAHRHMNHLRVTALCALCLKRGLLLALGCAMPRLSLANSAVEDGSNAAAEQPADQAALARVAIEDEAPSATRSAVKALTDQSLLAKVAIEAEQFDIRGAALQKLSDQVLMAKVAGAARDVSIREAATRKLTDQALLAKISVEDKAACVRVAAVEKLVDPSLLGGVAVKAADQVVRQAAAKKLTDQVLLARIAIEDEEVLVRRAAVKKLTDQALLAKIAIDDKHPHVRCDAVDKVGDQAVVAKIAVEDKEALVRNTAVRKLTDQATLASIGNEDTDSSVREAAVEGISDQAALAKIAVADGDALVRRAAMAKLSDQALLAKIVMGEKDAYVRDTTLKMLTDQAVLAEIALEDTNSAVRGTAAALVTNGLLRAKIADRNKDRSLAAAAAVATREAEVKSAGQIRRAEAQLTLNRVDSDVDPVSAYLLSDSDLVLKTSRTREQRKSLENRRHELAKPAVTRLSEDRAKADAAGDARAIYMCEILSDLVSSGSVKPEERVLELSAPAAITWQVSGVAANDLGRNFHKQGLDLVTIRGQTVVRVRATISNATEGADQPYTPWSFRPSKRFPLQMVVGDNFHFGEVPGRWLDNSHVYLLRDTHAYMCIYAEGTFPKQPTAGGTGFAMTTVGESGKQLPVFTPKLIPPQEQATVELFFVLPEQTKQCDLLVVGGERIGVTISAGL